MPKSIYLTDEQYQQICEAARKCGYRVQRGRGSQLAVFVVAAANTVCTGQERVTSPEAALSAPAHSPAQGG
jgi:hypothetical protein